MNLWIKHPRTGEPDAMLSIGVYSVIVILFKFLCSEMSVGPLTFGNLDSGVITAILAPTLGAYVARKYTDRIPSSTQEEAAEEPKEGESNAG